MVHHPVDLVATVEHPRAIHSRVAMVARSKVTVNNQATPLSKATVDHRKEATHHSKEAIHHSREDTRRSREDMAGRLLRHHGISSWRCRGVRS